MIALGTFFAPAPPPSRRAGTRRASRRLDRAAAPAVHRPSTAPCPRRTKSPRGRRRRPRRIRPRRNGAGRTDGVRSGGRRWRVQMTMASGAGSGGRRSAVRSMSIDVDVGVGVVPDHAHTSTRSAGTAPRYACVMAASAAMTATPATPSSRALLCAAATFRGSASTARAETSKPRGWSARTPRRSRHRPAPGCQPDRTGRGVDHRPPDPALPEAPPGRYGRIGVVVGLVPAVPVTARPWSGTSGQRGRTRRGRAGVVGVAHVRRHRPLGGAGRRRVPGTMRVWSPRMRWRGS